MSEKLEIGMYVRTYEGYIAKLIEKKQRQIYMATAHPKFDYIFDGQVWDSRCTDGDCDDHEIAGEVINNTITEASFDIIDLIKEGDYVNGRKVYQIGYNFLDDYVLKMSESNYEDFINPGEIKEIITKESFERERYVVMRND